MVSDWYLGDCYLVLGMFKLLVVLGDGMEDLAWFLEDAPVRGYFSWITCPATPLVLADLSLTPGVLYFLWFLLVAVLSFLLT